MVPYLEILPPQRTCGSFRRYGDAVDSQYVEAGNAGDHPEMNPPPCYPLNTANERRAPNLRSMKLRGTKVWGGGRPTWELPASVGAECLVLRSAGRIYTRAGHSSRGGQRAPREGGRNRTATGTILRSSVCFLVWLLWVLVASGEIFCPGAWTLTAVRGHHCSAARRVLVPQPGIELASSAWEGGFLTPRTTEEVPGAPSLSSMRQETPGSFSAERHSLAYSEGSPLALRLQIDLSDRGEGKRRESGGEAVGLFQAPAEGGPEQSGD